MTNSDKSNLIDYSFIEIGCSDFETLIQSATDEAVGLSVEPLQFYLNRLPDKKGVTKCCCALTTNKKEDTIDIYYIPPDVIEKYNMPYWLRGCNRIGCFHGLHVQHNLQPFVKIEKVKLLNVDEFWQLHKVRSVGFLKTDTEGVDDVILNGLLDYLQDKGKEFYPKKIMFESNEHTPTENVDKLLERFYKAGYKLVSRGYDTIVALE